MRKLFVFLCILTATTLMLASTSLVFWHYWDGANGKKLEELVERFNKENPDITIKPVFIPGSELLSKIQTATLSGRTPDLAISDIIGIPLLIETGKLVDLMPFINRDNYDVSDFYEQQLVYGRKGNQLYKNLGGTGGVWKGYKGKNRKMGLRVIYTGWRRNHVAVASFPVEHRRGMILKQEFERSSSGWI